MEICRRQRSSPVLYLPVLRPEKNDIDVT